MNNNPNHPPFHVGQRVVCVSEFIESDSRPGVRYPKKNKPYTVRNIIWSSEGWFMHLEEIKNPILRYSTETGEARFDSKGFAPIHPRHQDVEIAEDIIVKAKELVEGTPEVSDKKKQKPVVAN